MSVALAAPISVIGFGSVVPGVGSLKPPVGFKTPSPPIPGIGSLSPTVGPTGNPLLGGG